MASSCRSSFCSEITYTPPGDENSSVVMTASLITTKQLAPPPGDENLIPFMIHSPFLRKQPTPRQGTKTTPYSCQFRGFRETTHTPSGDENHRKLPIDSFDPLPKQLTPRQGTKTLLHLGVLLCFRTKQPTPRQGTKKAPYPCG